MATRQGGVHISYLVVAVVICLGLIGFVVLQNSKMEELRGQISRQKDTLDAKEATIKAKTSELNKAREVLIGVDDQIPDYQDIRGKLEAAGEKLAEALGEKAATEYGALLDLYEDSFRAVGHWRSEFEKQRAVAESRTEETQQLVSDKSSISKEKDEEIARLNEKINSLQLENERILSSAKAKQDELHQRLEMKTEEFATLEANLKRKLWILTNRLTQKEEKIAQLQSEIRQEQTFDQVDPDGRVIQVLDELGYVWIDLTRANRLRRGIVFDVFQYVKGGKRQKKGRAEVIEVGDEYSKAQILETYDELNPVTAQDYIASPFYSSHDEPVFVFAGDRLSTQGISIDDLRRRITDYGGKVEDKVRIETTYLVAIQGYESTQNYKDARDLGITILREDELLEFVHF